MYIQWRIQKILVGGNLKHKTSKIRMSSPKLRVIFRPNSEIQTFFRPNSGGLQKKKKVFTKIESDFSAEIGNSNVFFAQIQVVSKKKKKGGFRGGMHPPHPPPKSATVYIYISIYSFVIKKDYYCI